MEAHKTTGLNLDGRGIEGRGGSSLSQAVNVLYSGAKVGGGGGADNIGSQTRGGRFQSLFLFMIWVHECWLLLDIML